MPDKLLAAFAMLWPLAAALATAVGSGWGAKAYLSAQFAGNDELQRVEARVEAVDSAQEAHQGDFEALFNRVDYMYCRDRAEVRGTDPDECVDRVLFETSTEGR